MTNFETTEKPAGSRRKFVIRRPWNPTSGISRGRERRSLKRIARIRGGRSQSRERGSPPKWLGAHTCILHSCCQSGRRRRKREREGPRRLHPPICLRGKGKEEERLAHEFHPRRCYVQWQRYTPLLRDRRKSTQNAADRVNAVPLSFSFSSPPSPTQPSSTTTTSAQRFDSSRIRSSVSRFYAPKATRDSSTVAPGRCSWLRTYANSIPRWHRPSANLPPDAPWPARSRSARCSGY